MSDEHHDVSLLGLDNVPRGTLLGEQERVKRLESALPALLAATEGETDEIALEATLSCLLYQVLVQSNWCGFYRRVQDRLLKVGPYQGGLGCVSISFERGVCGCCARTEKRVLVPDVHAFPDHIACDSKTNSELVIPVFNSGRRLIAVLDLDSTSFNGFSEREADLLERLLEEAFRYVR